MEGLRPVLITAALSEQTDTRGAWPGCTVPEAMAVWLPPSLDLGPPGCLLPTPCPGPALWDVQDLCPLSPRPSHTGTVARTPQGCPSLVDSTAESHGPRKDHFQGFTALKSLDLET